MDIGWLSLVPQVLQQGLIYALCVLGFGVSLRMLAYADLTLEGSFVLGGVVSALVIGNGTPAPWSLLIAFCAGGAAGLLTSVQHCYLKVNKLLSGIISLAILYSVNLRLLGKSNFSFRGTKTLFRILPEGMDPAWIIAPMVLLTFLGFWWLLQTRFGLFLRACGENERVVAKSGYSRNLFIICGLVLANGAIALSGSLFSQYIGFCDVNMGGNLVVVALTSLIIGEILLHPTTTGRFLAAILVGSAATQAINRLCIYIHLYPTDHKGIVGILLIILIYSRKRLAGKPGKMPIGADIF